MEEVKEVRGVGVILIRNSKVLLGLRTGAHGADTWAPPGGKEKVPYERQSDIAARELEEETGMKPFIFHQGPTHINYFEELREVHRSTFIEVAVSHTAEPKLLEPDKCKEWRWFDWYDLPQNLFPPFKSLVESGYRPRRVCKRA
jgi:8-oxo-dGTP diphosphatase